MWFPTWPSGNDLRYGSGDREGWEMLLISWWQPGLVWEQPGSKGGLSREWEVIEFVFYSRRVDACL